MKPSNLFMAALATLATTGWASAQNDDCTGAIALALGATAFDTTGATNSGGWPCAGGGGPDLWFTYTPSVNAQITLNTCTGTTYDSALQVFSGDCANLTSIQCNDDSCGLLSQISWTGSLGVTYLIRVGGWNNNSGTGSLDLSEVFIPDVNDECGGALPLALGATAFDTRNATTSPEAWPCAGGGSDLWYTFTAASNNLHTVQTCGATHDSALEVLSGTCGALTSIACNDDSCGLASSITWAPTAGTTYYVRVGGFNAAVGLGDLTVIEIPPPPANCFETTFASNNGGSVGGQVFFDLTTTQEVSISGLESNYGAAAGTAVGMIVFVKSGTFNGFEQNAGAWTQAVTDDGSAIAAGQNNRTAINFSAPLVLPAGTWGVCLRAVGSAHRYTNGTATNTTAVTPNGVISFQGGKAQNTPFSSAPFSPRIWNGALCYNLAVGASYCGPAVVNASGASGTITAVGSDVVADNNLYLSATNLPMSTFVLFLTSPTQGFWANPGGSAGNLCLGGAIGRGVGGQIFATTSGAVSYVRANLQALPTPILISVAAQAGETWNFQAWFRDAQGGTPTSNFTDAVSVTFQ